jgi:raffinose/stachyose/melibiose transport system permease protein
MISKRELQRRLTIAGFLLPGGLLFALLVLNPLVQAFILSTYRWVTLSRRVYVGFENYLALARDRLFWFSMRNTFIFVVGATVLQVGLGFVLGYFLYLQLRGYRFFKTVFFIPAVLATVGVGFVWGYIYSPSFGLLKPAMEFLGLGARYKSPLATPSMALFAIIVAQVWHFLGIQVMMFNAGFMNMPQEVMEMASLDGASGLKLIWYMVLPLSWEITKSIIILQVIGALRSFDLVFVMTGGGPNHSTEVLPLYMFVQAFENFNIGNGAVAAVVIFVLAMGLTMGLRRMMSREVLQY